MGILTASIVIAIKSPIVIGKRMAIFAGGGRRARVEARTAVTEKTTLAGSSAVSLIPGKSLASVVRRYRRKVEANSRRLWLSVPWPGAARCARNLVLHAASLSQLSD